MYKCEECGRTFEEPKTYTENHGEYFGRPALESVDGCPYCGGEYTDAWTCSRCGEKVDELYWLCEDCTNDLKDDLRNLAVEYGLMDETTIADADEILKAISEGL